jgi:hypothetical protein
MKPSPRTAFIKNISSLPGWRTRRKLVVFESDDWGSIRMPSREAYENLQKAGLDLVSDEGAPFNLYDTLAGQDDLAALFEVLSSVRDSTGRAAVFTPESVVANPDFEQISQSGFTRYAYEPFTETLQRYPGCGRSFDRWKEGIEQRLFVPQFHGREHLNVPVWMRALQEGLEEPGLAFENRMWGITTAADPRIGLELQAAFDFRDPGDLAFHREALVSGLGLFGELFGYRASCFVPPNGRYSTTLEPVCAAEGIRCLSVSKIDSEPLGNGKEQRKFRWLGRRSEAGMTYLTRNCFFEPSLPGADWVERCLYEISVAFRWNKPALVSSHRVNYIGRLYPENRSRGLKQLARLLNQVVSRWPDAEFVTSSELGEIIHHG